VRLAVDLSKLGFSTLIALSEDQLSSTGMTPAGIRKAVQDATEVFDACTRTGGNNDGSRIERA
jgi:hypothetical protein